MQLLLTDQQRDLRDLARTFFADAAPPAVARARLDSPGEYRPAVWKRMAQLGFQGITIDEEHGGSGAGLVELAVVLEEAGRALLVEPLLATAVLAAGALRQCGGAAAGRYLAAIAAGDAVATLAFVPEPLQGVGGPDRWAVTGTAPVVVDGAAADLILVPARTERGLSLFAVAGDAPSLRRTPLPALDRTRALALLEFDNVAAERIGAADRADNAAGDVLDRILDEATIALAAEQIGGARACLDMAVGYARTRVAFGRAIGSFQALKHRLASLHLDIEAARAAVRYASWAVDAGSPDVALLAAVTAADCAEVFVRAAEANIQIHGGIGFTWEHDAHLYLKRALAGRTLLRSPESHRARAAQLLGI